MPRVLLADDDPGLLDVLGMALEDAGYEVVRARDGKEALARIGERSPDVVVSDVNMPHVDGFTLCRRLRAADNHVPIVLLTSRDGEIDEALGLELGADDYVTKPFRTRALLARIQALLRRDALRGQAGSPSEVRSVGHLTLDEDRLELTYAGTLVSVTVTEFRMVEALTERPGIVWSRERLLERMRGDDSVVADRLVDTYVGRMRRKLEALEPSFDHLETVVGAGYRWRAPERGG